MVLFPLVYGELYSKFNLKPPRGLLFYGPPGTGKTLVASALAIECSSSERKVSFIFRKGSDCLSKYVGESEKKLRKIFQSAQQAKPCIIFFDEVDGLAPTRSNRQDFVHASVVSTLLALMDGLDNNSEIIVIGATNRLEAIDPALRRPGRFDRELYFPLPCYIARKDILSVYVKSWKQKPSVKFLAYLASKTVGYCGSDLQALCAEAVMCCVRRHYPQIYSSKTKFNINERTLKVEKQDFVLAQRSIVPASCRVKSILIKCLSSYIFPLLEDHFYSILNIIRSVCPSEMLIPKDTSSSSVFKSTHCPRLLLCGRDNCHTRHLGPALLHNIENLPCHLLDVVSLFEETGRTVQETIIQKVKTAKRTLPSILYVPDILTWWNLVEEISRNIFISLMKGQDRSVYMFVLITISSDITDIPHEIVELFDEHQGEIYEIQCPNSVQRKKFFQQLFLNPHTTANTISNHSSYGDFLQVWEQKKKRKMEVSKQSVVTEVLKGPVTRSSKMKTESKSKLSYLPSRFNQNLKRKRSKSDEKFESKKLDVSSKILAENRKSWFHYGNEQGIQNLLSEIVERTEKWTTLELEGLYFSLQGVLSQPDTYDYTSVTEHLTHYFNYKKSNQ
ncbi:ATPase family AAA domain-containing protein 2B isoform X2 [Microplitis demolitor]|nr:ATPase family AAA domain-containing protein 2B isoform X2 [Microplitis demolitor]